MNVLIRWLRRGRRNLVKNKILILLFGLGLLVWSRFYNLEISARFIWDESSDLVRMQELFKDFRLTMLGPMSEDGIKIFGSLTYYLTLPFVIAGNFSPVSSAWATAFFGILTVVVLLWLIKKNKTSVSLVIVFFLLLFSYPLLQSARWAWNPHFIPFWQSLGLVTFLIGENMGIILSGLFFGLTIHHHYYGLFVALGFLLIVGWKKKERLLKIIFYLLGLGIAISPFILFDLTHPPGLFLTRMVSFSPLSYQNGAFNVKNMILNMVSVPWSFARFMAGEKIVFGWIVLILSILNIFKLKRDRSQKWLLVVLVHFLGLSTIGGGIFDHYLLPAVIFYYLWIISSYKKSLISKILIYVLIVSNVFALPSVIFKNDWSTNIKASEEITGYIVSKCNNNCKNYNLVVLGSPDFNTKGRRYRDLLRLKNIELASMDKYSDLEGMFVVSYLDWNNLKNDPSYEINDYRELNPTEMKVIQNSKWKIYYFDKK